MTDEPEERCDTFLTLHLQVYPAGSVHHLHRGEVKQYKMHHGCFALEYAVGGLYSFDFLVYPY
jgi:ERG2 and Sigma1 receptor like protein